MDLKYIERIGVYKTHKRGSRGLAIQIPSSIKKEMQIQSSEELSIAKCGIPNVILITTNSNYDSLKEEVNGYGNKTA